MHIFIGYKLPISIQNFNLDNIQENFKNILSDFKINSNIIPLELCLLKNHNDLFIVVPSRSLSLEDVEKAIKVSKRKFQKLNILETSNSTPEIISAFQKEYRTSKNISVYNNLLEISQLL